MAYFNYHGTAKRLIWDGKLIEGGVVKSIGGSDLHEFSFLTTRGTLSCPFAPPL